MGLKESPKTETGGRLGFDADSEMKYIERMMSMWNNNMDIMRQADWEQRVKAMMLKFVRAEIMPYMRRLGAASAPVLKFMLQQVENESSAFQRLIGTSKVQSGGAEIMPHCAATLLRSRSPRMTPRWSS